MLDADAAEMRIHTLCGADCDAFNDIGKTQVSVTRSDWMPFRGSAELPPHPVSVIELR